MWCIENWDDCIQCTNRNQPDEEEKNTKCKEAPKIFSEKKNEFDWIAKHFQKKASPYGRERETVFNWSIFVILKMCVYENFMYEYMKKGKVWGNDVIVYICIH